MSDRENLMRFYWTRFARDEKGGGKSLRLEDGKELELLYRSGFVDGQAHSLEEWTSAFEAHRVKDGSYLLNETEWLEKGAFVSDSRPSPPFDPMTLREGPWEIADFDRMIEEDILPSLLVDPAAVRESLKPLRDKVPMGACLDMTRPLKAALKNLLIQYPSPRRWLQLRFSQASPPSATAFAKGRSEAQEAVDQLSRLLGETRKGG